MVDIINKNESKRVLEAALFMSPSEVSIKDLAKTINSNIAETRVLVNELVHSYDAKDTSLEIRGSKDGFIMGVKPKYEDSVGHMAAAPELHKGLMKTLAYIAYRQPVKQSEVINFRNSKAYEHIKILKDKGFIRKEKTGISYTIYTTPKFREYFGKDVSKAKKEISDTQNETHSAPISEQKQISEFKE